ncbi:MAG: hypothetical protein EZS28_005129 [Streblomastix strix]|uniref:Uncharacterized protein n=1 Tax=Streblomastix strix TaxID=222440 RepID=A0A5J4WX36_9EUKA|nr:MAG: hypothetical protein EZS28_005129 [Streblomastix strix]
MDRIRQKTIGQEPITISNTTNTNSKGIGNLNYIFTQHNTPRKSSSSHFQQYSRSPSLGETLAILKIISPVDPRGCKKREPDRKQPKLQQYVRLMDEVERFHEIMKLIIEEEKKKPKVMLSGQYNKFPNKEGPLFFYPPKYYLPIPIPRPKDLKPLRRTMGII